VSTLVALAKRLEAPLMNDSRSLSRSARTEAKRDRIVETAMRHFAEHGYQGARVDDIATELSIAKGSIFQHFGSKSGLFFEVFKTATRSLPAWLDAPKEVLDRGFFACVQYWLEHTGHLVAEDWVPNRVALIGAYGTDLKLKHEINRWLLSEDPYGTLEFVEFGVQRGEVRDDIDLELVVSILDWLAEGFQDAIVSQELDPGLFHRYKVDREERQKVRIDQFAKVLRSAIGRPQPLEVEATA
jgi:AcrR family transcriptional regulator